METSSIAFIVSWLSLGIAALSLGWNIYRDVIIKPKVKVTASVKDTNSINGNVKRIIAITATNYGPGIANLQMLHFKERKKGLIGYLISQFGFIIYKKEDPYSCDLPGKLEVGDRAFYPIPYENDCILKTRLKKIGISDVFGRIHWASRKNTKKMLKQYKKDFGNSAT